MESSNGRSKAAPAWAATGGTAAETENTGLMIQRYFTTPGEEPLERVRWVKRSSVISNPDGSTVFEMKDIDVPDGWSQLATDIVVSKYFRKAGVPGASGSETSVRQVVYRVARTLREAGEVLGGYFRDKAEADTFESELTHLLVHQRGAFNSPVWFNCGLAARYDIRGRSVGTWFWNEKTGNVEECPDSYTRPQLSACFIQSIKDDLLDIADAVKREMRLFKFGSGTGTNFSAIRGEGEKLAGGGTSSGLMSFLEVLDKAAGATKSGGTTRRAAKMVILDMDHPEIENFVLWKAREEDKAQALIDAGYDSDFNGEVYRTVSGQNSNNSVRITDDFMQAVINDRPWETRERTEERVAQTYQARDLMDKICYAAWRCADPGIQYDTTINRWHTCPNTDRIHGSNPCSEYMFLDDSACNLASLNLMTFLADDGSFDVEAYRQAIRMFFIAQEIAVDFASYPTETIARNSHDYRPLGLGYANLGTMLMVKGIPYDSAEARVVGAAISAITTGHAYRVSAEMAREKGPFPGYARNRDPMLRVMNMHRDAAYAIDDSAGNLDLVQAAREEWDDAVRLGERHGYRNGQATVIAPTGTIGLLMDCDTTGIEPDFALVKFKKLAGGGYFKIINQSVPRALKTLGYSPIETQEILNWILGRQTLEGCPGINRAELLTKGLSDTDIDNVEANLSSVFDFRAAFASHILGADARRNLGVDEAEWTAPDFDLLGHLGFSDEQVESAEIWACGTQTIEGAPHLRDEHLAIFDCANRCGPRSERFIHHSGHINMMAAVQPFVSGAISKTVNMPADVSEEDIRQAYMDSWQLGLKAVALYRDGCKGSQPLNAGKASKAKNVEADTSEPEAPAAALLPDLGAEALKAPLRRRRLPKKRTGFTQEGRVGGNKVYVRTGNYEDGSLGEIFVDMHKEGAAFRSIMNCFAISVSLGLQYGVPLEDFVEVFTFTRFDPQGPVDHPNIKWSTSIVDYIFRLLAMEYLGRNDFVHVKPADGLEEGLAQAAEKTNEENRQLRARIREFEDDVAGSSANPTASDEPGAMDQVPGGRQPFELPMGDRGVLSSHLSTMMGDAPFCDECGHMTVRNGACYKCLNCGASAGCS
ncbi:MAG: ribonucleoside-diphosphate reductase, adenosylcobalamin-dependent [Planctomycetes bacterium]|nr:ribonucleoside-diphosphate reductase, adenosylcobalamin-dependent [Planctomycetota bacterium]